jgi:hypothetical protein
VPSNEGKIYSIPYFWFAVQPLIVSAFYLARPFWSSGYYDIAPGMVIVYGYIIPGTIYIISILLTFSYRVWSKSGFKVAWKSLIEPIWLRRSLIAFTVAFLINGLYLLPRPW